MAKISNGLVGFLNLIALIISLSIIGLGIWFSVHDQGSTMCERFLRGPVLVLGSFFLVISLLGLIGSCRSRAFLWIYLFFIFAMIIAVLGFAVLEFMVINKLGLLEDDRAAGQPHWLKKRLENKEIWQGIESCLSAGKVCGGNSGEVSDFYKRNLSPIQTGCCRPPPSCGFEYHNATFNWTAPIRSGSSSSTDSDCKTWNSDHNVLCYYCKTCKAGVLANLKSQWKKLLIFEASLLLLLIIVYSLGCCAFENKHRVHHGRYQGYRSSGLYDRI